MTSTSAMFAGLSGLSVHSRTMEVIGNNISNVNTPAFKTSRMNFETQMSRVYRGASAPADTTGGTNPYEIGQGAAVAGTSRMMTQGQLNGTGNPNDLAIDGEGFFVVDGGNDDLEFTRAGALGVDGDQYLTTVAGQRVLGYGTDADFVIDKGTLQDIQIPIGGRYLAEATTEVRIAGNLNAAGDLSMAGSLLNIGIGATSALGLVGGGVATLTSALTSIANASQPTTPMFEEGQFIELQGARKGSASVPDSRMEIGAATTVQDLIDYLSTALGVRTTVANPDGTTPGGTVDATTGAISLIGNSGSENNLDLQSNDIRLLDENGVLIAQPFGVQQAQEATGESVRTNFVAYDSLGNEVDIVTTLSLEAKTNQGTTWRYWIDSHDGTPGEPALTTGLLQFDTSGRPVNNLPVTVSVNRDDTGAATPLTFSMFFGGDTGAMTSLVDVNSAISTPYRDGRQTGVLEAFGVEFDGTITGSFSNGLTRTLGQIPLAMFTNPAGLTEVGQNSFRESINSGAPQVVDAQTAGSGNIVSGSLEQSNVDLGKEFIGLILTSTGYSASSRVIRTSDELLQQLLSISI
ncbi:MAG: flagellar hook-basal body complex protein [Phycisphaeraceae bacterium]|nr:flagellar hook-basal body complex protein [Phycisphaerales bacterium]MCB9860545.1 flagellar hook-basal body complex protein [Phycisphaeraceae bacterium]